MAQLMALAVMAVAVLVGDFAHGIGVLIYVAGLFAAFSLACAWALPMAWLSRLLATGALVIGSLLFSFPFVWMLSTSFKYPEEIFVYPPRWVPVIPEPVRQSPYITLEELSPMVRPEALAVSRWDEMEPELRALLWRHAEPRITAQQMEGVEAAMLREAVVTGLWTSVTAGLPTATWEGEAESILQAVEGRLDDDRVGDVWPTIHRGVALRNVMVRDEQLLDHPLDAERSLLDHWQAEAGSPLRLMHEPSESPQDAVAHLAYDLSETDEATMVADFPLPVAMEEWLAVTLPIRQDRSWHRLRVELEVNGRRYVPQDRLFLGQRRWQEITFKFKHMDDRDERDLGVWQLVPAQLSSAEAGEVFNQPGHFRMRLHIERSSRLGQLWHKYTDNYRQAFLSTPYRWHYVFNSFYLVVLTIIGQIFACSLVAYSFARLHWPGRDVLFVVLLATMMLPPQVTMIPVFMIFRGLGWYNTLIPLWIPSFLGTAFFIFLLRQFMKAIPAELEDAARIDGCGYFGIYWRIILPLMKPALAAVGIFTFMNTWNEFMGPLIYLNDQRLYPLALGLFDFRTEHGGDFGLLMAASTLMTLPVVALFFMAQRYFIQGITLTGIKG
ncbi:ABC transporter permease subunit [Phycisphaerales bacterium AB-hyl4]|uniref:ABC transporter permease subunit n=1 Tax=Natronomicrosphaera hydrolytica TaxID=3242702 RepID=A0ABV4U5M2_9BACT